MKKYILNSLVFVVFPLGMLFVSCGEEDLEPVLEQDKDIASSVNTEEDMENVIRGSYSDMADYSYYGRNFIIYGEVRSDNTYANGSSGRFSNVAEFDMLAISSYAYSAWERIYQAIAGANIIISKEPSKIEGDINKIKHIQGQAFIIRALGHFDLLRLYGEEYVTGAEPLGVPYITKYKGEDRFPRRNTITEVQNKIVADLNTAKTLMDTSLNDPSKVYFNTWSVSALQSRVYLYFGKWDKARDAAKTVIDSKKFSIVPAADFAKSWQTDAAVNSIFEIANSDTDNQGINSLGYIYKRVGSGSYGDISVLPNLKAVFEASDVRGKKDMIGLDDKKFLSNLGKYPSSLGYNNIPIIRYEEVILNYAEALWRINPGDANALTYLNKIPENRDATPYTTVNENNLLLERRKEFAFEGFRFYDLARTGRDIPKVDSLQNIKKTIPFGYYMYAFPIPKAELNANSNMVQNKGYQKNQ